MQMDSSSTHDKSLWQMQFAGQDVEAADADGENDEADDNEGADEASKGSNEHEGRILLVGMCISMRRGTQRKELEGNVLIARKNKSLRIGFESSRKR